MLPAYTLTGFDASAHTSEETLEATRNVPKGIVRSVAVSAGFGWVMIVALLLAMPDLKTGATKGIEIVPGSFDRSWEKGLPWRCWPAW